MKPLNILFALACSALLFTSTQAEPPDPLLHTVVVEQQAPATNTTVTFELQVPAYLMEVDTIHQQQVLRLQPTVQYASFNPFSVEQECCGGGGWQSPYIRTAAFTLLALLGAGLLYRLRYGTKLPWTRS